MALIVSGCGAGDDEPVAAEPTTTGADAPPDARYVYRFAKIGTKVVVY